MKYYTKLISSQNMNTQSQMHNIVQNMQICKLGKKLKVKRILSLLIPGVGSDDAEDK